MRGTQNWLLVEVLGQGATETVVVIDRLVDATEIGPRVVVVIGTSSASTSALASARNLSRVARIEVHGSGNYIQN